MKNPNSQELKARLATLTASEDKLVERQAELKQALTAFVKGELGDTDFQKNITETAEVENQLRLLPELKAELEELIRLTTHNEFMETVPLKAEAVKRLTDTKAAEMSRLLGDIIKALEKLETINNDFNAGYASLIGGQPGGGILGKLFLNIALLDYCDFGDIKKIINNIAVHVENRPLRAVDEVFEFLLPDLDMAELQEIKAAVKN